MKRVTQKEKVKEHLEGGKSITPMDALEMFGCFRLAAIICNLREEEGMRIDTELVTNRYGTKYAKYTLVKSSINNTILDELNPTGEWRK
tara:strand:- start:233 stop:499 length:267 start_codon:yes stop_codon:yes gene_type:complete